MTSAFYSSSIANIVDQASEAVLGHLAKRNPFALAAPQRNAWLSEIDLIRRQLQGLDGWIAFEFAIPRMGKRADVVMVAAGIVFVIEFKVGSHQCDAAAFDQVMDYALRLRHHPFCTLRQRVALANASDLGWVGCRYRKSALHLACASVVTCGGLV